MEFVALLAGLAGLWLGTKATIRGAVSVAERLGISEFVIGVVVLSVGSDLPELAIAVDAGIKNQQYRRNCHRFIFRIELIHTTRSCREPISSSHLPI